MSKKVKIPIIESEQNCWCCGNNINKKGNPTGFKLGYCLVDEEWFSDTDYLGTKNCRGPKEKNAWIPISERKKQ